jgi:predicted nucleotidyltransferase
MLLNNQIKIFEEFLRDYTKEHTGSFISKKKNLNQKTVSNYLNKLEKEHILKSKTQGKNKLYSLNLKNKETVKHFIIAVEHLRTIEFYKNNLFIKEISEKIQKHIKGTATIFGSYVKGTQKDNSDIDILIIGKCYEKEINNISKIYNKDISFKIYPRFKKDILTTETIKSHILIKNTEAFVEEIING